MNIKEIGKVISNEALIEGFIYLMKIRSVRIAEEAAAGQFVEIRTGRSPLLRKPISLFEVEKAEGTISILYQVKGEGTRNLAAFEAGDDIDLIGPLGRGFTVKKADRKCLLVGGGIGIAPLYQLGRELKGMGTEFEFILGFGTKDQSYALDLFEALAPVQVTTMDGSLGVKGTVGAVLDAWALDQVETVYSCGPEPMLKYVQAYGDRTDVELSLEAYMGCGLGACLSCVCEKKDGDYARVCKDGPVFKAGEVVL